MGKTRASFWAVVGVLLLAGCAHKPAMKVDNSEQPYRIGREDVLDVAVWRDADLSRTLPVRPDGYISMPMTGDVLAAGKTPGELAEEIKTRLKPYVQEPRVTVIVREVNSSRIFVTGEVANPGAYPLRGRVSLIQAIALAGGFTDFANADGIVVIRSDGQGGQIPVSYSDLISPDGGQDVVLRPGDTIVVP
ncbi:MAG: polysaccharide biosynthesis/export family protein [Myxococcaceae bacterium]|nr:polysaccharide biosynthesis/export family protein [Myxococcaceae bacterium]